VPAAAGRSRFGETNEGLNKFKLTHYWNL